MRNSHEVKVRSYEEAYDGSHYVMTDERTITAKTARGARSKVTRWINRNHLDGEIQRINWIKTSVGDICSIRLNSVWRC